jgi:hypothetical protein
MIEVVDNNRDAFGLLHEFRHKHSSAFFLSWMILYASS